MQNSRRLALAIAALLVASALLAPAVSRSLAQARLPAEPDMPMGWNFKNLSPEQQQRMLRFSAFVNKKVPEDYIKAENSVGYTTNAIAAGGPLYLAKCAKCHGDTGLGNGELAYSLNPSPALLAYLVQQPIAIDQYLLWTISEGGKQFGTAMPSFKTELTQDQIWQIRLSARRLSRGRRRGKTGRASSRQDRRPGSEAVSAKPARRAKANPLRDLPLAKVYQTIEPGPVVLLATAEGGRANVMAMSWHMMVDFEPPLIACIVRRGITASPLCARRANA